MQQCHSLYTTSLCLFFSLFQNLLSMNPASDSNMPTTGAGQQSMKRTKSLKIGGILAIGLVLAGCGNSGGTGFGNGIFKSRTSTGAVNENVLEQRKNTPVEISRRERNEKGTVWDLFAATDDPNVTVEVNKYIWNASLDVLDFLPIEGADPFSGVIVTGYGTPPGGGRAYRATVFVQDPALDARSLNLSLNTRSGPASRETIQAVEDAILTRARQLRIQDGRL